MAGLGLEHAKTYKIQSVFDGSVLDLKDGHSANGSKIQCWEWNGTQAQKWTANKENTGFRLAGSVKSSKYSLRVIDLGDDGSDVVQYWDFHGLSNQQWTSTHIGDNKYLIKSCHNLKAIRNQGRGSPVKCVVADKNDISQQWRLEPL